MCVFSVESLDSDGVELCSSVPQHGSWSHAPVTLQPQSHNTTCHQLWRL